MLVSSWLWHLTRWGGLFCCSYLVTHATHAPFLSQLVGALIFAPMLLGFAAGSAADRVDRRRAVMLTELTLVPVTAGMFALVQTHVVQVWMAFPFMVVLGVGGLVNMTAQRALIADISGPALTREALAMESAGLASASMAGPLVSGVIIARLGIGGAFGALAVAQVLSIAVLAVIPRVAPAAARPGPATGLAAGRQALGLVRRSAALRAMLGVTVIFNACYFAFMPLVPVIAEHFHAGPGVAGLIGSGSGMGTLAAGLVLATRRLSRPGVIYVVGAAIGMIALAVFSLSPSVPFALAALVLSGMAAAGFTATQSSLAIDAAPEGDRGLALGLVSVAIGALPIGMLLLGLAAQLIDPRMALLSFALSGVVLLALWTRRRPELVALDADESAVHIDAGAGVASL